MVFVQTPEATALPKTQQVMTDVDEIIKRMPEIESTAIVAGFNMIAGIAATNCGIIFVKLVDYSDRKLSAMEISDKITQELYVAESARDVLCLHSAVNPRSGRYVGHHARSAGHERTRAPNISPNTHTRCSIRCAKTNRWHRRPPSSTTECRSAGS